MDSANVFLIDFGLSGFENELTFEQTTCGTPGYMPPEAILNSGGARYSAKGDVFGTGCILYLLLAGKHPYDGETAEEVMKLTTAGLPSFEFSRRKDMCPEIVDLLLGMLEADPNQRYSSWQVFCHPVFDNIKQELLD